MKGEGKNEENLEKEGERSRRRADEKGRGAGECKEMEAVGIKG